jgi:TPR repeat protein
MGVVYAEGKGGLPVDQVKALDYLDQADGMNEPYAAEYLGRLNFHGHLVPQDYARSAIYFRKAMGYGRMKTAAYLAQQYDKGLGVSAEPLEAARLYYFAAGAGQSEATAWMADHPEITEDSLATNHRSPLKDPPTLWTSTVKGPDGRNMQVPVAQYMFSQLKDFFPDQALNDEVEGSVAIDCHWNNEGNLDNCLVLHESPVGYGFAQATLRMLLRPVLVTQKTDWKTQYAGKSFYAMIRWVLD